MDLTVLSVLNVCSTATRSQRRRLKSRLRLSTLPRPVYESSCWTPKEIYETSHDLAGECAVRYA